MAGAVIGAAMAAMATLVDDPDADVIAMLDETMACLESGFQL
jgi:hypothetical protein